MVYAANRSAVQQKEPTLVAYTLSSHIEIHSIIGRPTAKPQIKTTQIKSDAGNGACFSPAFLAAL
jgi:hypothetical protein